MSRILTGYGMIFVFTFNLLSCRSLNAVLHDDSKSPSQVIEPLKIRNTIEPHLGDVRSPVEVTESEMQQIYKIGEFNNHAIPLNYLKTMFSQNNFGLVSILRGDQIVGYLIAESLEKDGIPILNVVDAGLAPEALDGPEVGEILNKQLETMMRRFEADGRTAGPRAKGVLLSVKSNKHVYVVEFLQQQLGFLDTPIEGVTTVLRDAQTQIFAVGKHAYVRGSVNPETLRQIEQHIAIESKFEQEKVVSKINPESWAALYDANFRDSMREFYKDGFNRKMPPLDSIGRELALQFLKNAALGESVILTGEAGTGKSYQAELFWFYWLTGRLDDLLPDDLARFKGLALQIDAQSWAGGTHYVGTQEDRVNKLRKIIQHIEKLGHKVALMADEVQQMAMGDNSFLLSFLKDLAKDSLFVLGLTTKSEYEKYFKSNEALDSRFSEVAMPIMEENALLEVVAKHYLVSLESGALADGTDQQQVAASLFRVFQTFQPNGSMRRLRKFARDIDFGIKVAQRNLTKDGLAELVRKYYSLPNSFRISITRDDLIRITSNLENNVRRQYGSQVTNALIQKMNESVIAAFSPGRVGKTRFVSGSNGAGRTYLATLLAKEIGRPHIEIILPAGASSHVVKKILQDKIINGSRGSMGAVVSFVGFEGIQHDAQLNLLEALRSGFFDIETNAGSIRGSLQSIIAFINVSVDNPLVDKSEAIMLDARSPEVLSSRLGQLIEQELKSSVYQGVRLIPNHAKEIEKRFIENNRDFTSYDQETLNEKLVNFMRGNFVKPSCTWVLESSTGEGLD